MENSTPDMLDVAFDLKGSHVPAGYTFGLWDEVVRVLPWLNAEELAGILPLRGSEGGTDMLLPQRAKLVLRLPAERATHARGLSGRELHVGSAVLQVGEGRARPFQPHPTLHAHLVESAEEEEVFLSGVATRLREMEIACQWLCGRRHALKGAEQTIAGYSLVLHDLKPEASLQVQRAGLGGCRRYGCGIFVPYKAISGLD